MNIKEIQPTEVQNYIGKLIWFQQDDEKSKPRLLKKCSGGGYHWTFDSGGHETYIIFCKDVVQRTKIFTYAD